MLHISCMERTEGQGASDDLPVGPTLPDARHVRVPGAGGTGCAFYWALRDCTRGRGGFSRGRTQARPAFFALRSPP